MVTLKDDFHLRVSDDRLAVVLDCGVDLEHFPEIVDRVEGALRGLNVAELPSREDLEKRLRNACRSTPGGPVINKLNVVEGIPITPPRNGEIRWAGDFFAPGFTIDEETGAINYREHVAKPSVTSEQLLAVLIPRQEGKDGTDVFGKRIQAPRARPARIRPGAGVRLDDENNRCYAKCDGRARYVDGILAVDHIYTIEGSVGLSTGNIDHPGALVVEEDVETGSTIRAGGDVSVGGLVESADIECGGHLDVRGGITGIGARPIKVAGRVQAKFVLDAQVTAGQEVAIAKEAVHSNITSQTAICMPSGRLVGGEIYARHLIDVKQAGSEGAVSTSLSVGLLGEMAKVVAEKEKELTRLRKEAKRIRDTIDPLVSKRHSGSSVRQGIVRQLTDALGDIDDAIMFLEAELEEIQGGKRPQIIVRGTLYPETTLTIGHVTLRVKEALAGPVRAVASKGAVHLQPWGW